MHPRNHSLAVKTLKQLWRSHRSGKIFDRTGLKFDLNSGIQIFFNG